MAAGLSIATEYAWLVENLEQRHPWFTSSQALQSICWNGPTRKLEYWGHL